MCPVIASGAEAIISLDDSIIHKDRILKGYRIPEIDLELRKQRTRREVKVLLTLEKSGFPAPRLVSTDKISVIKMEFIEGKKLSLSFESLDYLGISEDIGKKIAMLHNLAIIHGDLTTSNMIFNDQVYLIDFGLSFFSYKIEDMAVDLHLLRQALESKHHTIWEASFRSASDAYLKNAEKGKEVMSRLKVVEERGRNKSKF